MAGDTALLVECLPSMHKALSLIPALPKPHVVAHTCSINTPDTVGGNQKFEFIIYYIEC